MDKLDLVNIQRYCCDPFGKHKKKITKDLRTISANLIKKYPSKKMTTAHRVCRHCQSELTKDPPSVPTEQAYAAESVHESSSDTESMIYLDDNIVLPEYELGKINTLLRNIDETPIKHSRISHSPHYAKKKIKKVGEQVKRKLALITQHPISSESCNEDPENEMIQQLIEKFNIVTSKSEKLTILTLLPKSWTRKNITEHFKCSDYMARQAKQLVRDSGVFSTPNPRLGKRLPNEVAEQVIQFYHSPEMSRVMPGLKDCISVKRSDGSREIKQKYLILCNLKEAYQSFKEKHPALKIGFSKFAELRPKECVLPGSSGTHSVCICTKHQNVKLMMAAIEKVFKCGAIIPLEQLSSDTTSICRTQKVHCIRPISKEFVEVFAYSFATESRQERVTITQKSTNDIPLSSMKGYCVAVYDDHWYLACILEVMPETNELRLSFLHPHGPTRSFAYPSPPDELIIDASDMLMIVNPITMTGRTYSLKQCEQDMATSIIDNH
ncbi:unnamed protein product [Rotaria magnacalcarata]|uniref:Uncharacterized protein n=1 Tax=Rotaria magnacalcarata TaxID=392030 RepID=A0A820BW15_9BILA|nr:unnamed protein product [Rotaria magnacalcarata]